ncbi:MAG: AAA family ATPase [Acidobacteriota bacterium]|nr:AAA family ATPase [Acidobacteriota bacterium]
MTVSYAGYRIVEQVYESRNSLVYRAHRLSDQRIVIIKQLKEDYPSPDELTRYRQEYEITRDLDVPGVIEVYSQERAGNTLIIAMEDFGAHSLKILWPDQALPLDIFFDVAIQAAGVLGKIHEQEVIHKDINPANLVYNRESRQLKVIDFGIATRLRRVTRAMDNPRNLEGTLPYTSPEQTGRMNRAVDYRADLYSLGATLYELLCGRPPFLEKDPMALVHCHIARQPVPPHHINKQLPPMLSDIVLRLLAKHAEQRYQSAWGLCVDLERCAREWRETGKIEKFEPGTNDISTHFEIPQKIYGRDRELAVLTAAFERALDGHTEFMRVGGYAGVGKSALIQELFKPLTRSGGYFISGKFDQYRHNTTCTAVLDALEELARQLMSESDQQLREWNERIHQAVGGNGRLITDAVPAMAKIMGPQPPLEKVDATAGHRRYLRTLSMFLSTFCRPRQPLVIFVDDLQWADPISLDLMEWLAVTDEPVPLLFIGAYRDNEVDEDHPLTAAWKKISKSSSLTAMDIKPLDPENVGLFIADTLHQEPEKVTSLRDLVYVKTGGNPFFTARFLESLHEEGLLLFSTRGGKPCWTWDDAQIERKGFTDNLVELMVGKLKRQPPATREVLQTAACMGNRLELDTLALVCRRPLEDTYGALLPAIQEGFVLPLSKLEVLDNDSRSLITRQFKFCHDRVQQAAYQLIEPDMREQLQFKIGNLLLNELSAEELNQRFLEVVDYLNAGRTCFRTPSELERLGRLNMEAGTRAMDSAAHAIARDYLETALDILGLRSWEIDYDRALTLYKMGAEAAKATGDYGRAELLLKESLERVRADLERAGIYYALTDLYLVQSRHEDALDHGRRGLALMGMQIPEDCAPYLDGLLEDAMVLFNCVNVNELPPLDDPFKEMVMTITNTMLHSAYLLDPDLFDYLAAQVSIMTMTCGHSPRSEFTLTAFSAIIKVHGRYEEAVAAGAMIYDLFRLNNYPLISPNLGYLLRQAPPDWTDLARERYRNCLERGYLFEAGMAAFEIIMIEHYWGRNLDYLEDLKHYLSFAEKFSLPLSVAILKSFYFICYNLNHASPRLAFGQLEERAFLAGLDEFPRCVYLIFKAEVYLIHGNHAAALTCSNEAETGVQVIRGTGFHEYHQWTRAVILAAAYRQISERKQIYALAEINATLCNWKRLVDLNPELYEYQYAFIRAERLRIEGRVEDALQAYKQAAEAARVHEFRRHEALIHERVADYWNGMNLPVYAQPHLREAWQCYRLLDMGTKVDGLSKYGGEAGRRERVDIVETLGGTGTETAAILDFHSVIKAGQAISGHLHLPQLLRDMMTIVIENAGAQRGCLLLKENEAWVIRARGEGRVVSVLDQGIPLITSKEICIGAVQYVTKSGEPLILDHACREGMLAHDPYVMANNVYSLLCLPIQSRNRSRCLLYLENNISAYAFTPQHLELLHTLTSQMAISLENALLYEDLERHNRTLEEKVARRTRELEAKNRELALQNQKILKAQQQLVTREKMASLGVLTAGVAHEINNPTNFAHGGAQNLEERLRHFKRYLFELADDAPPEMLEALGAEMEPLFDQCRLIKEGTTRINHIVHDLRLFTRKDEAPRKRAGLSEALASTVNLVRANYRDSIHFNTHFQDPLIMECCPAEMNQVFMNLIVNACDAVKDRWGAAGTPQGEVTVTTSRREDDAIISIADNGCGMTNQTMAKIFQPFYTTKEVGSGTGLGLSISYGIIQQHDGHIDVTSKAGEGSTFTIQLPMV